MSVVDGWTADAILEISFNAISPLLYFKQYYIALLEKKQ